MKLTSVLVKPTHCIPLPFPAPLTPMPLQVQFPTQPPHVCQPCQGLYGCSLSQSISGPVLISLHHHLLPVGSRLSLLVTGRKTVPDLLLDCPCCSCPPHLAFPTTPFRTVGVPWGLVAILSVYYADIKMQGGGEGLLGLAMQGKGTP